VVRGAGFLQVAAEFEDSTASCRCKGLKGTSFVRSTKRENWLSNGMVVVFDSDNQRMVRAERHPKAGHRMVRPMCSPNVPSVSPTGVPASTTELSMESHSFINKPIIEDMFLVLVEPPLEVVIDIPLRNHEPPKIGALFGI
jgi:hypothetical protein